MSSLAEAQEPTSLRTLLDETRTRSPTLHAARARVRAARAALAAAGWPQDPMAEVEADRLRPWGPGDEEVMIAYRLLQPLPIPGQLGLEERVARAAEDRSQDDLETAFFDVELLTTRAFLMLRRVDGELAVNDSQKQIVEDLIGAALAWMRAGGDTHHDVVQSQVELLTLESERTALAAERAAAVAMVNALRDRPPQTAIIAGEIGLLPESLLPAATLERMAIARRSELRSMRSMAREERAMAALMRREAWPMLRVGVWYNQMLRMPDSAGVMVGGNLPLFGVPRQSARAAQADARASAVEAERAGMRAMIRSQVRAARERYLATTQRLHLVRDVAIPRAEEVLVAAHSAYRAATTAFASVVQDRRTLSELRMELVRLEFEAALAWAELLRQVGAGSLPEAEP
ncbi:MAG: TolC family protein [Deltaproteobacteria bacterium]|nr:TolC family protein [Deltaproteobacteria bacterium]